MTQSNCNQMKLLQTLQFFFYEVGDFCAYHFRKLEYVLIFIPKCCYSILMGQICIASLVMFVSLPIIMLVAVQFYTNPQFWAIEV